MRKILNLIFVIMPLFIWYYPQILIYSIRRDKISKVKLYNFAQKFASASIKGLGMELEVKGTEYIENTDSCLLVGNHQSFSDTLMVIKSVKYEPLHFVAKKELEHFIGVGRFIRMMGGHFMDRGNKRDEIKIMRKVKKDLRTDNTVVCIFPEGTRSKNENYEMNHFHPGTFNVAVKEHKNIVPFVVEGGYNVLNFKRKVKSECYIHFLPPLRYEDYKDLTTIEIANILEQKISEKQKELHKLIP